MVSVYSARRKAPALDWGAVWAGALLKKAVRDKNVRELEHSVHNDHGPTGGPLFGDQVGLFSMIILSSNCSKWAYFP